MDEVSHGIPRGARGPQLRPYRGGVLDADAAAEIERRTLTFLAGRRPLFDDRVADGHIVDGHADLIADDIFCLDDGPRALDCLEFDDRLRFVDVLDDAAPRAADPGGKPVATGPRPRVVGPWAEQPCRDHRE